jgi:hypothetical protein
LRNHFFLLSLITLVMVLSGCLTQVSPNPGPTPPLGGQKFSVSGVVKDANTNLAFWNGTATLNGQSVPIRDGGFQFSNQAPGTYTLTIERPFYKPYQTKVVITTTNITLTAQLHTVFSSNELDLLARLVYAEAKGENYEGQVAVASSVLNRVLHPDFPNTLSGVINQVVVSGGKRYYQYEPVLNGTIHTPPSQAAKDAVSDALVGWDPSLGATGFFAPKKVGPSSWVWSRPATVTIGNHRFFK